MNTALYAFLYTLSTSMPQAPSLNHQELTCLTKAVYHEARGESMIGKAAVAHVVLNRYKANTNRTICQIVYEKGQFTDITKRTFDYKSKAWADSIETATLSYVGYIEDPTDGGEFFFNPPLTIKLYGRVPKLFNKLQLTKVIGKHWFYKRKAA